MMRVNGHRMAIATERLWRIAILTVAGAIGATAQAEAALYDWPDSDPGISRASPTVQPRRTKSRHQAEKRGTPEKESTKPQGPLIISISIAQQRMRIFDANGFFAETPVSTGMPGHPTPMGVFSVIQKDRFHRSNIYSGAPMPFMQRITWSGIAIHAGVLPGHPASHGCIRMPMAFAVKMWNWTRMGARVIITPGDITPDNFSHPLLAAMKVVPQPVAADEPNPDAPAAAKTDKAADANGKTRPAVAELRSTIGQDRSAKAATDAALDSVPSPEQARTADAGNVLPVTKASGTPNPDATRDTARAEPEPATGKPDDVASSEDKSVETKSAKIKSAEATPPNVEPTASKSAGAAKADVAPGDQPRDSSKTATPAAPELKKDQSRPTDGGNAAAAKP